MPVISSGVVAYPAGSESASYVVPIPATAVEGDVLVVSIDIAVSGVFLTGVPANVATVIEQSNPPAGNLHDSGVYGYTVSTSRTPLTFTFPSAVRGNAVWVLLRGHTLSGFTSAVSGWAVAVPTYQAPSVPALAGSFILGGLSAGSGSATVTAAAPWEALQSATQRKGFVASRGVQLAGGPTGVASFGYPSADNSARAWQAAFPPAGGPHPEPSGGVVIEAVYAADNTASPNVASVTVPGIIVPTSGCVLIAAVAFNNDNEETVSHVRLNASAGAPFTRVGTDATTVDDGSVGMWLMVSPAVGTHSVTATLSAALNTGDDLFTVGVWVLSGADLTTPIRNTGGSIATQESTATPTIAVTSESGDLILGAVFAEANIDESRGLAPAAGTNQSWVRSGSGDLGDTGMGVWKLAAGASETIGWTINPGETLAARAIPVVPGVAPEPPDPPIVATLMTDPYPGAIDDVADGASIVPTGVAPGGPFIIGTRKDSGGGLYVLNVEGEITSSVRDGASNSVDWREVDDRLLVLTVDRDDDLIRYYWMNPDSGALTSAGSTSLAYEPYGSCLYVHSNGAIYAFVSDRGSGDTGTHSVRQYPLTISGATVSASGAVRTISVEGVMEGMAADDQAGHVFISREDYGLYRYSAAPNGSNTPTTVDTVGGNLVADVEDVAIARRPDGDKLVVSSQGVSSFHIYDLITLEHEQRFTVVEPNGTTPITGTDGLDIYGGAVGDDFPNGLLVVHTDTPNPSRFAYVDAAKVLGDLPEPEGPETVYWDGSSWVPAEVVYDSETGWVAAEAAPLG